MNDNGSPTSSRLAETLMRWLWRRPAAGLAERARRRVTVYLVPYLFFLYILAYLDRVNVSVAALRMVHPVSEGGLGFTQSIIGFGAGIFFWGYWILEVPSTLSVLRWGARWVFVRILVLWGLACVLVGLVGTPFADSLFSWLPTVNPQAGVLVGLDRASDFLFGWLATEPLGWGSGLAHFINGLPTEPANQFYFFRFMLGFFEGGFFPSVILYLSLWFRAEDRAKAIAGFMAAIPISSMLGTPLSGLLLNLDWLDLPGWRWIFILQGAAPVVAGVVTLFFLPDRPEHARWLPEDERACLVAALRREHHGKQGHGPGAWAGQLGTVLLLTAVYFGLNVSSYGITMFLPAIIKSQTGLSDVWVSLVAAPFYLVALVAMLVNGRHSDRRHERIAHVAVPLACLGLALAAVAALDGRGLWPVCVMVFVVGTFMYAHLPAFWPLPTKFLGVAAAAAAIGFINMIGNLGGSVGPMVVGNTVSGGAGEALHFGPALAKLALFPLAAAVIVVAIGITRRKQLAARPEAGEVQVVDTTETVLVSASLQEGKAAGTTGAADVSPEGCEPAPPDGPPAPGNGKAS
jgi:MFS family permease